MSHIFYALSMGCRVARAEMPFQSNLPELQGLWGRDSSRFMFSAIGAGLAFDLWRRLLPSLSFLPSFAALGENGSYISWIQMKAIPIDFHRFPPLFPSSPDLGEPWEEGGGGAFSFLFCVLLSSQYGGGTQRIDPPSWRFP